MSENPGPTVPMQQQPIGACPYCHRWYEVIRGKLRGEIQQIAVQPQPVLTARPLLNIYGPNGEPIAGRLEDAKQNSLWSLELGLIVHPEMCEARWLVEQGTRPPILGCLPIPPAIQQAPPPSIARPDGQAVAAVSEKPPG